MRAVLFVLAAAAMVNVAVAHAAETVTYTYDAKGRVITVSHSGSVNNGTVVQYTHDKADNRTKKKITGAP